MECNRALNLLDAYMDAELDPIHALEIDAHLMECARCSTQLEQKKKLQHALRTQLPYFNAPNSLKQKFTPRPARPWKILSAALAACLFLSVGGLTLSLLTRNTPVTTSNLLADAVEADHLRSLLTPEHLTDVLSSDQHTVKPWFTGKLPFSPPVHDFASSGFPLLGGRIDILNHQPVAALVYRRNKHLINLFLFPTTDPDSPPQPLSTPRGYHILHFSSAGLSAWAISDVEPSELSTLATLLQSPPHSD